MLLRAHGVTKRRRCESQTKTEDIQRQGKTDGTNERHH